ncbi:MAG: hypothetical protein WKF84_16360 [Pyrinomonadaceae bacterium]
MFEELDERGRKKSRTVTFDNDEGVRRDSFSRSPGEVKARSSCARHHHRRKFFADVGRRRCRQS